MYFTSKTSEGIVNYLMISLAVNDDLWESGIDGKVFKHFVFVATIIHIPLNIIIYMYFLDQTQLLSTLEEDWSNLLRSIKNRQEIHLQLIQRNRQILFKNRNTDDQEESDAQIAQIKSVLSKCLSENNAIEAAIKETTDKYQNSTTSAEQVIKVMTRVASKVLEITQATLDKSKSLDSSLSDKHCRMKQNLVNMLGQRQKLNLEHLHNIIFDYSNSKVQTELLKMEKLLKSLEDRQFGKLNQICNPKQKPRISSVQRIRQIGAPRRRQYSLSKEDRSQAKRNDQIRKQKNKVLCELYGIMLLSKYQFVDDYSGHSEERKERLFNELLHKNKKNLLLINEFRDSEQLFEDKVKIFDEIIQSEEKELPQERQQLALKKVKAPEEKENDKVDKEKDKVQYHNHSYSESLNNKHKSKVKQCQNQSISFRQFLATEADTYRKEKQQEGETDRPKNKLFGTRGKIHTKQGDDFPHIFHKTLTTQQNQCLNRVQPLKKEIRFQVQKGKLPDIYRKSSLDGKTVGRLSKLATSKGSFKQEINNMEEEVLKTNRKAQKWFRDDKMQSQRTKVVMKNVEVGIPPMNPRKEEWLKREEGGIVKERKKTDSLMGDTAYCKRTLNKFFDGKLNGLA